jgi:type I restriction enzyme R subunit
MTESTVTRFEPIVVSDESTVVAEYVPDQDDSTRYQSEADLEREFIRLLGEQAYEYLPIHTEVDLVANLRRQLEALNGMTFSDSEWEQFYTGVIASPNAAIADKTAMIQENHVQLLRRDDGTIKNVRLIDKQRIHNNRLQVINQYEVPRSEGPEWDALHKNRGQNVSSGIRSELDKVSHGRPRPNRTNRYDVTILVNGLPMVHVELKRRGIDIREAFNQIERYQRDSFWSESGLFEYVQLFVISNGTLTKYYSNTTRWQHLAESGDGRRSCSRGKRASHSFEFTSWWADASNRNITNLYGFTRTFFAKHALLAILTRYCVLSSGDTGQQRPLLVMRPYQIVATERILSRIATSSAVKQWGTLSAGGYVWHTTGSGKTLTSFKTAQLATQMEGIDKVLFVVDRKDLDYQTMREYDRFAKGAANSNTSTAVLRRQLENPDARIIITTIQKLSTFIKQNTGHAVFSGHIVVIFDECHRSQFGDMHTAITRAFRKYHLFGFTGTPIFTANMGSGANPRLRTTAQAFGDQLHSYTIVDAIKDKNVLPFRVDYINTVATRAGVVDKEVAGIDTAAALSDPRRVKGVVDYVLEHFDQKTRRSQSYDLKEQRVRGFNSLFACDSIPSARQYYTAFQLAQEALPQAQRLKIATIFSYAANEEDGSSQGDGVLDEESFEPMDGLDATSQEFLEDAIQDYNGMFGTSFDTSGDRFQNYYKDLSLRLKNRELDMVIVVNMFLTGFDATTLNTLWVDKNLRAHGLIQAFSRTNRILNSVKTYGNIVCFRDLDQATNEALELFGNTEAGGIVLLRPYAEYFEEYARVLDDLTGRFGVGAMPVGEQAGKEFVALFSQILRLRNILVSFDEFAADDPLTDRDLQDHQSIYLRLRDSMKRETDNEKETINDDVLFEIELVKQVEVNVDYILMLVEQVKAAGGDDEQEIRARISRAVDSSPSLRHKKDLIEAFVDRVGVDGLASTGSTDGHGVTDQWQGFVAAQREKELTRIIDEEQLRPAETRAFVDAAFRDGEVRATGTAITRILPPASRFAPAESGLAERKAAVIERLTAFFDRFFDLG